ncbi:MAG: right-handed parallel beta-helix repeat-containing protein [Kiritimatiellales bacterium]
MKKRFLNAVLFVVVLFTGAVAVTTADRLYIEPRTVSSWGDLYDCYLSARTSLPPLPFACYDVAAQIKAGDWSFLADHWQYTQTDGSYYIAKDSKLAKLKLPLHIRVYEDLERGEVVILSSTDGEKYQGEALFKAPEFMPYEKDFPLDRYLSDELSPRRVVWEITLKSEADAWADLINVEQASSLFESQAGMSAPQGMMRMMVPEENANDLWLCLEPQSGSMNLNVFAPEGFTNRVEVYSCADLISNVWNIAVQELLPSGTNPAVWSTGSEIVQFYRAGNMDVDSDGDGLPDAREQIVYKTNPNTADTDGDGYSDDWEVAHGMDPLSANLNPQEDSDSDGYLNIYEYANGGDPANSNSIPTATRYVSLTGSNTPPFTSWATASTNIQAALNAATNDYEIIAVADGAYTEFKNHVFVFPTNPVMLTGVSSASNCVLDGKMFEGGHFSGLEVGPSSSSNDWTVLRNITFMRGMRDEGVFICDGARLLIDGCALLNNYGGYNFYGADILVKNSTRLYLRNTAIKSFASFIKVESASDVAVERCEVEYETEAYGIGVNLESDCSILGDSSTIRGGSYGCFVFGSARIEGLTFEGNETGIECWAFTEPQIKNCVFVGNISAVSIEAGAHPAIEYCTFTGNTNALTSLQQQEDFTQGATVRDSIIWGNLTAVNTSAAPLTVSVSNSCVQSGLPVDGNITNAPQFEYVWRLATNSPCLNAGTVANAPTKDADGDVRMDGMPDIGADEYADTDGDGLCDWAEMHVYGTNPNLPDSDGDGMPDGWEVACGLNPLINDANGNPDGDGLTNAQECAAGTDPHNSDSDGDGLPDGVDVTPLIADTTLPVFTISYPTNGTTVF